jgi:hypothetical protein
MIDYPNPVLSTDRDDYVESCKFDVTFNESDIQITEDFIQIPAKVELISTSLSSLINEGKAAVVVLINSSAAFYRKAYVFNSGETEKNIEIPKFHVKGKFEFTGYILANENIDNFSCDGEFNELYFKSVSFSVKKADVLAKGETRVVPVDDSELEKPISSIFMILRNPEASTDMESDFDSEEKIIIKLSDKLNDLYYKMKDFNNGSLRRYLTGIVVFPVLVEAIAKMCECHSGNGQDYSEKRWFRAIEHKLNSFDIDLSTSFEEYSYTELADKLLGSIALDGLNSVNDTINEEVNGGEYVNTGGLD